MHPLTAAWPSPYLGLIHGEGKEASGRVATKKSLGNVEKCLSSTKFQSPAKRFNFKHHSILKEPESAVTSDFHLFQTQT